MPCLNRENMTPMKILPLLLTLLFAHQLTHAESIRSDAGRLLTRSEIQVELAKADFILLGEHHDNPQHHIQRAELISALATPNAPRQPTIVMEYLQRGHRVDPALPLLEEMEQAGFSLTGWNWPLHEPLFVAARAAGLPILGGNLSRADARRVAMQGESALDAALAAQLQRAPLSTSAQQQLDEDLNSGHCGHLPPSRLPNMRLAQRARDAALASTLLAAETAPAILLAGNGHVRRDYGVARLLLESAPQRRIISIGFYESGPALEQRLVELRGAYDYIWITPPAEREDPCAGFSLAPISSAVSSRPAL